MGAILFIVFTFIVVGMLVLAFKLLPGTQIVETSLSANDIKNNILHGLSKVGFIVTTQTDNSLTLVKETKPNCVIGCVLLILFVVPAIIYAVLGGNKQPVVVTISESGARRTVKITGPGLWVYIAKRALN